MAGRISELTELTVAPDYDNDYFEFIDTSETADTDARNKRIKFKNALAQTKEDTIECHLIVQEGTVAYPDIYGGRATAGKKLRGFVFPDGASAGEVKIQMQKRVWSDLAATPNAKLRIGIMTLGAVSPAKDLSLVLNSSFRASSEDLDVAFDAQTESNPTMPATTETLHMLDISIGTNPPAANDWGEFTLKRDPTDAGDTFTDDIMVLWAEFVADRRIY